MKTTQSHQLPSFFMKFYKKTMKTTQSHQLPSSLDKKDDSAAERQQQSSGPSSSNGGEDKKRDLEAVFAYMDANRDGRISPDELQKSFKTLGEELSDEEAEAAVRLSDTDGDGMLDFEEFALLIKGDDGCSEEEKKNELKEAFRMYTAKGEECITPRSLKMMLKKLGETRTTDDCKVMIRAFDLNADGVLSFDEFALMMR